MRSSSEIKAEIATLEHEFDATIAREEAEHERRLEAQKGAEEAERQRKVATDRAMSAEAERRQEEAVAREKEWWRQRREMCYVTPSASYAQLGLCQAFLGNVADSELQANPLCQQCLCGARNPSWLAGTVGVWQ